MPRVLNPAEEEAFQEKFVGLKAIIADLESMTNPISRDKKW
jgi:hypothetical protein